MFGVEEGVICQQVNCRNVMGAGIAKAIKEKYPIVETKYHESFKDKKAEDLFGKISIIPIGANLYIANIYSQLDYGNPTQTGKIYTDKNKLVSAVNAICSKYKDIPVYLPYSHKYNTGIGCGFGGEKWETLDEMFKSLNKDNLMLLDANEEKVYNL